MGNNSDPFEIRGKDVENLGKVGVEDFSIDNYSKGEVDEDTIGEVMEIFGDDQIFHDGPYVGEILSDNTEAGLLGDVRGEEITAPAAPAVYQAITESPLPVTDVQVECNSPIDTADHLEPQRTEMGGKAVKEIYRGRDGEEPAMQITLEYGVPSAGEEYTKDINRQNASEFVGVLGTHPQDGNLIQSAEASFAMTDGTKDVSRETDEPVYSTEEFDIRPNHYITEGPEGQEARITFNLVETDEDVMANLVDEYSRRLEEEELEGTITDAEELREDVEELHGYLEDSANPYSAAIRASMGVSMAPFTKGTETAAETLKVFNDTMDAMTGYRTAD